MALKIAAVTEVASSVLTVIADQAVSVRNLGSVPVALGNGNASIQSPAAIIAGVGATVPVFLSAGDALYAQTNPSVSGEILVEYEAEAGGGGSSSLLWGSYWSLAHAEITTGVQSVIGWEPSGYGVGTLDSVTIEDAGDGPGTHVSFADVGCYMVSFLFGGIWTFADGVDPANLFIEAQVDNSEQDPWVILPVLDPTGSPGALGTLCSIINVYEDHDPVYHGFAVVLRPRNISVTPLGQAATMKIVKLA